MKNKIIAISLITMSCLYGMLAGVIILIFIVAKIPITYGILLSIMALIIQFLVAPSLNDFIFKHFYKMTFDSNIPQYLQEFIREICAKYNMNYPKIGYIDDGSPNAFTYGRTKNDARIIVTKGIFKLLTEDEVKVVVAHELGHANHYDMLFMTVAQIVPLVLYYVSQILLRTNTKRSSKNDSGDYLQLIGLISYVLYIISQYIILWLSRTREYYADSFAIEETQNPRALGNALVKIGYGLSIGNKEENSKVTKGNALGISNEKTSKAMIIGAFNNGGMSKENIINAMKWERWNIWAKINELSSTHPLISKRLLAISNRSEEFGQEPFIEFDEEKTESYLDDFLIELFIACAPFLTIIITSIIVFSTLFSSTKVEGKSILSIIGCGGVLFTTSLFILFNRQYKNNGYQMYSVKDLLSEVKVSKITSIPCILKGKIIGRGNPGCIFNEDFVLQDETGIIFLDYNQPLYITEKIFAIFKSEKYFDKDVVIKGWYRRGIVPYIELHSIQLDGEIKKCHTHTVNKVFCCLLMAVSLFCLIGAIV